MPQFCNKQYPASPATTTMVPYRESIDNASFIHDINNMLGVVLGMADMLSEELPAGNACQLRAVNIVRAVKRCASLLNTMPQNNSLYATNRDKIQITALVDDIMSWLTHAERKARVKIKIINEAGSATLIGDLPELSSALLNVCMNAIEAMPDGGILRIGTSIVESKNEAKISSGIEIEPEKFVQIKISDTGAGIPKDKLPHIYEPLISTKGNPEKPLRGLGLYRVRQCVLRHGGTIQAVNNRTKGATFTIILPVSREKEKRFVRANQNEGEYMDKTQW